MYSLRIYLWKPGHPKAPQLSHQISLVDIMNNLPTSIKEESFKSEEEFATDLKGFLENNPLQIFKQNLDNQIIEKHGYTSLVLGQVKCDSCDRVISSKNMKRHKRLLHEKTQVKSTIQCDRCDKWVSNVFSLSRHMKLVHNANNENSNRKEDLWFQSSAIGDKVTNHRLNIFSQIRHICISFK